MIVGYTLSEGEIKIAIAQYLTNQGKPTSARSVYLQASANYDMMDRPMGSHTISATAQSNS